MKTLEALILTFNLDGVKQGLQALGLKGMTLHEAPSVPSAAFLPRIHVRVVVPDHIADRVEEILRDAA